MMSLECELARVQMKRYLAGEELPSDLQKGLESHVRACASCRAHLNEQRLKLAGDLAGKKGEEEARKVIGEKKPKPGPSGRRVFAPPSPLQGAFNVRTLALSGCLAVVLFAMSAVAKDPTILLGPKAGSKLPAAAASHGEKPKGGHGEEADPKDHGKPGKAEESGHDSHSEKAAEDPHKSSEPAAESKSHGSEDSGHASTPEHGALDARESHPESHPAGEADSHKAGHEEKPQSRDEASSHHADPKPSQEKEPEKPKDPPAPSRDLLVADGDKTPRIKKAPAPHPRVAPKPAPRAPRRAARKAAKPRTKTVKSAAPTPAPRSGIRVYDSNGVPLK